MAGMKVNVDMSELDEAIEKAHQLSAMLDEIEARFSDENILREAAARHGYVLTPKMSKEVEKSVKRARAKALKG